jgi:signal transduction histidine kinase
MTCELELNIDGSKKIFKGGLDNGDKDTALLFRADIREGKKKRGNIDLRKSGDPYVGSLSRDCNFLESIGSQISLALQNSNLYGELKIKNEELKELLHSITQIQEREKAAIAMELHDDTGQHLTDALLNLEMALQDVGSDAGLRKRIKSIAGSVSTVLERLHDISVELHPPVLNLGLTEALSNILRRMNGEYPIDFTMEVEGKEPTIPSEIKINIYRIVQEALSNVIKHSRAKEAMVCLSFKDEGIDLLVKDNGKGCRKSAGKDRIQLGLVNMRERAEQIGGVFDLSSSRMGTTVTLQVPLPEWIKPEKLGKRS